MEHIEKGSLPTVKRDFVSFAVGRLYLFARFRVPCGYGLLLAVLLVQHQQMR